MTNSTRASDSTTSKLTRGGLFAYGIKVVAVGLGFVAQFLIARYLGTAGYGEFSFALVTLNFLVIGAVAGSDSVATRFVSVFRESPDLLRNCLNWLNRRTLMLAILYLVLALIGIQLIRQFDSRRIWIVAQVLCVAIPLQAFSSIRAGILRGRQRPALSQIPEELVRPILTILLVVAAATWWPETWAPFAAEHVAVILLLVILLVLVVGQWLLNRELPRSKKGSVAEEASPEHYRQWRSMAWASTLAAMAMTIHSQCDVWMLGIMVESDVVGPYAAAARYAAFVVFGINAVNMALGPLVAESANQKEKIQQLASRAALLSAGLSVGIVVVLLLFPGTLLSIFGNDFDQATMALRILVIANAFNVLCGSVGMLLNMSGFHNDFMRVLLLSLIVNIVLNVTLIPIYQTTGAAMATGISVATWNVLGWILVRKRLGVRPTLGGWI